MKITGIKEGLIVSLTGALSEFTITTIIQNSSEIPPAHSDKYFNKKVEVTGNETVKDGKVHIHIVAGQEDGKCFSGHLIEGAVTYFVDIGRLVG